MSGSISAVTPSSKACSGLVTPGVRWPTPDTDAKEAVRFFYDIPNLEMADRYLTELAADLQDDDFPPEVNALGRTLTRWRTEIVNWHRARASNGPAEAINNLVKRVKRAAFGFRRFRHYRIRSLLYAGRPDWNLLATLTPR